MAFHVPERLRLPVGFTMGSDSSYGNNGAFVIPSPVPSRTMFVIASDGQDWDACGLPGEPWEHVSVHCEEGKKSRVPTWAEMCRVKELFWDDEDVVVQFHPKKSEYVNNHESTLHLWRPVNGRLPTPPPITV